MDDSCVSMILLVGRRMTRSRRPICLALLDILLVVWHIQP